MTGQESLIGLIMERQKLARDAITSAEKLLREAEVLLFTLEHFGNQESPFYIATRYCNKCNHSSIHNNVVGCEYYNFSGDRCGCAEYLE